MKRDGMILFVITVVLAMLAVGALALVSHFTTEYEATRFRGDELQAAQLVQSGIEALAQTVAGSPAEQTPSVSELADSFYFSEQRIAEAVGADRLDDNPAWFRAVEVVPTNFGRGGRGAGRFTVFSPKIEKDHLTGVRYGLVNESSRLHLGSVLQWEIDTPGQGSRSLLKLPGMTPSIADSILDWIDPDKTARPSGAEFDYYERTGVPYRPRNAVPVSLEELLLVRDMTRVLLFGTDDHFTYGADMSAFERLQSELAVQTDAMIPPTETSDLFQQEGGGGTGTLPWCFLLTTLSAEKLVDPTGKPRFYLNDGNLEFLAEQLENVAKLDKESVEFVVGWRKSKGNIADPIDLLDAEITLKEPEEKTLKSPFSLNNSTNEEKFLKLLDFATTSPTVVVQGRINVYEASRIVLEAVPDLSQENVSRIVSLRGERGEQRSGRFRHPVWLLSEKIVDKETMKKLSGKLTTGGDVYRAQVVGFFDGQGTTSRAEVVVDATVKPPRQIFSKDLTMFGIAGR